jgi:hypothetical protein
MVSHLGLRGYKFCCLIEEKQLNVHSGGLVLGCFLVWGLGRLQVASGKVTKSQLASIVSCFRSLTMIEFDRGRIWKSKYVPFFQNNCIFFISDVIGILIRLALKDLLM